MNTDKLNPQMQAVDDCQLEALKRCRNGSIDRTTAKAVAQISAKAIKYFSAPEPEQGFSDAYGIAMNTLLEGKVSPQNADVFLKWLLDGGEPAKWESAH